MLLCHTDCLLEMVEPFLYNAGVDIVFHGAPLTSSLDCHQSMA